MRGSLTIGVLGLLASAPPLRAQVRSDQECHADSRSDDRIAALEARMCALERELAAERAKTVPTVTAGRDGFTLKSADGAFQLKLRGYLQSDGRFFAREQSSFIAPDTFLLRRARPIVEGTLFRNFDFRVMPDFGGGTATLQDAYIDLRFAPAVKIRAGKFKGPVGLERLASATDLLFVERALPTALAPNRDIGILVFGDLAANRINYTIGLTNGVVDGASTDADDHDGKDLVARVFALPFTSGRNDRLRQLGVGVAGSSGTQRGTLLTPNLPILRTSGQAVFARYVFDGTPEGTAMADGTHWRVSPQGYYYTGPIGVLAEFIVSSQRVRRDVGVRDIRTRAWQVATSYVVTGEDSGFRGIVPRAAFEPSRGGWGALELTARYNTLRMDRAAFPLFANPARAAREARAWAAGANWYLNRAVKVSVDFEETRFGGGAPAGNRGTERNILTRFQIGY